MILWQTPAHESFWNRWQWLPMYILMGKYDMSYIVVMSLRWFLVYHSNKGQQFLDWHENECEVYTPVE